MNTRSGNKKMEENVENLDNMKKNEDISQEQVIETQQNMENRQEKQGQDEAIQMLIGMMIEAKRTRQKDKEEAKEKEKLQEERYIKDKEEAKKLRQEENEKLEEFKKEIRNILRREEAKQANILDERIQTVRGEIKEVEEKQQEIREEFNQRFEENKKNLELETKRNAIEFKQELIRIDNENADITKSVMKNEEAIYRLSITVNNELKKNVEKINLEMTNKNLELKRFAQGYKYGMVQEGIYRTSNSHNERNDFRDYRYQQDQPRFGQNWYNNSRFREENRNQQGYHNYNFREHGYRNNFNRNFSNNENNYNQPRNREGNQNQNGHNENRERRHYNEDRRESNFRPNRTFENNNIQSEENNQIQGRGRGCRGPQRGRAYYINNMNLREVEENNHCGSNNEEEEVINETVTAFDTYWKACRQFRMAEIKTVDSTASILDKWPFYKTPSGFRLIWILMPLILLEMFSHPEIETPGTLQLALFVLCTTFAATLEVIVCESSTYPSATAEDLHPPSLLRDSISPP
ncbi:hypothetical protein RN001_001298 [Aquatica leii]|uniref:Uncharacterized protein n=1 Tax=Aquatica leii TaxID=1421715 RepID=A0AAN7PFW8_9COLE|nr:hypothetical protein RN001_001298 [Aquatica leii]